MGLPFRIQRHCLAGLPKTNQRFRSLLIRRLPGLRRGVPVSQRAGRVSDGRHAERSAFVGWRRAIARRSRVRLVGSNRLGQSLPPLYFGGGSKRFPIWSRGHDEPDVSDEPALIRIRSVAHASGSCERYIHSGTALELPMWVEHNRRVAHGLARQNKTTCAAFVGDNRSIAKELQPRPQ